MMETPHESRPRASLSDYLAAERTVLAWIRTGLALMGFGFVVARFGLFLQQLQFVQHEAPVQTSDVSLWLGTALIASGVLVCVSAGIHHLHLVRCLDRGDIALTHTIVPALVVALFLALVGLGMTFYLISIRYSNLEKADSSQESAMTITEEMNIVDIRSSHSVEETVNRLKNLLESKNITLFALVDHSGEAEKVGMKMKPTKLLIFGSPKAGTPVMLAAPSSAIDLPLKILIWENHQGEVLVSYNSPEYLKRRHSIPQELVQNLAAVKVLAEKAAE
jgi:uncharacterized protein (DUF302 family)/uncharacterized membrane protein YidH (DUF202 family)